MIEYPVSATVVICAKNLILRLMMVRSGNKAMQHVASWHSYLMRTAFAISAANSRQYSQGDIHRHRAVLSKGVRSCTNKWSSSEREKVPCWIWYKEELIGVNMSSRRQPWLQWPWDCGVEDPKRREQCEKQDRSPGFQDSKMQPLQRSA